MNMYTCLHCGKEHNKSRHRCLEGDLRKLVERMRNVAGCTEPAVDAGEAVDYWAGELEAALNKK